MRWLGWNAIAALAGLVLGCADGNALYTSSKRVPGYTPSGGKPSMALAYMKEQERKTTADLGEPQRGPASDPARHGALRERATDEHG